MNGRTHIERTEFLALQNELAPSTPYVMIGGTSSLLGGFAHVQSDARAREQRAQSGYAACAILTI
jgi:hypothetical protein